MSQLDFVGKYVIDTSSIFDFWLTDNKTTRPYHVKVQKFREIWDHITFLVKQGKILVPKIVAKEIIVANQELLRWVESHKSSFIGIKDCLAELAVIVRAYPAYTKKRANKLNDAKIIAIAMSKDLTVLTSEKYNSETPKELNPEIPNVCEKLSVNWMNLPEFFEEESL